MSPKWWKQPPRGVVDTAVLVAGISGFRDESDTTLRESLTGESVSPIRGLLPPLSAIDNRQIAIAT